MLRIADCGLMFEPQLGMTMDELIDCAKFAEDLGFGYVFRSDHLLPTDNRRGIDSPECWTSLGAIASATSRVKFGPMVTPIGFRNPALVAKMACTLHSYSHGRLQLALGAGWYEAEYKAHGFPFPDFKGRVSQFREALEIVTSMVNEGKVDFDGRYFSAHTDCLPRPSGHMHLIIGARTRPMVRLAAKAADEWNFFHMTTAEHSALQPVLDNAAGGRRVQVSEMGPYLIAKTQSQLEAFAEQQVSNMGMSISPNDLLARLREREAPCGLVEDFVDRVRQKSDAGVSKLYFQTLAPDNREMVEMLADSLKSA